MVPACELNTISDFVLLQYTKWDGSSQWEIACLFVLVLVVVLVLGRTERPFEDEDESEDEDDCTSR